MTNNKTQDGILAAFEGASWVLDEIYDELCALEVDVVELEPINVVEVPERVFKFERDEDFVERLGQMPNSGVGSKREKLVDVAEEVVVLRGVLKSVRQEVRAAKAKAKSAGGERNEGE